MSGASELIWEVREGFSVKAKRVGQLSPANHPCLLAHRP